MLVRLAFGAGGNHEGFFGLGHGGPADFFDGVTKAAAGAVAAVVKLAEADAGGGNRALGFVLRLGQPRAGGGGVTGVDGNGRDGREIHQCLQGFWSGIGFRGGG